MNLNRSCKIVFVALLAAQNLWATAPTNNAVAAAPVAAPAPVDYSTFPTFVANRNIFDPNRVPNRPWVQRTNPPTRIVPRLQPASFSLVGVIGYGDGKLAGAYAFFDGTSQQYRKTVQLNGDIAVFKVSDIAADSVTLTTGTNSRTVLRLGEQLHEDGRGHWLTASGNDVLYNTSANSRNRNSGFGNQNGNGVRNVRQRGNGGNYNNIYGGGNTRSRNNLGGGMQPFDNSQTQDSNMGAQDYNNAPADPTPQDFNMPQNFIAPPDFNPPADPGQQNN